MKFLEGFQATNLTPLAPSMTLPLGQFGAAGAPLDAPLSGSHGHPLTAVVGEGTGIVNITSEDSQPFFSAEIDANVYGTSPDSTFSVKRRIDATPDGVCSGASFLLWSNSVFTTAPGGAGATHFTFENPHAFGPFEFDMQIEVSTADASTVLRSDCFTVLIK